MQSPPQLPDEQLRLTELARFDILDTSPEADFDAYTRLASLLCGTHFSTISLIDRQRQWFKAIQGPLESRETPRDIAFCAHALSSKDVLEVNDSLEDPRFQDNPLVTRGPMIRFYAGAPLITSAGVAIGTLCVFDPRPRTLSPQQREGLQLLAHQVVQLLEYRISRTLTDELGHILEASDLYLLMIDIRLNRVIYTNNALRQRAPDLPVQATDSLHQLFPEIRYEDLGLPDDQNWAHAGELSRQTTVAFSPGDQMEGRVRFIPSPSRSRPTLLAIVQDLSEIQHYRSQADAARHQFQMLNNVALRTQNPVIITDGEANIQWVNPAFERLTGYRLSEVQGRRPGRMLQGRDTSRAARRRIRQHLQEGTAVRQEILNYAKDGRPYWLELDIQPIRGDDGKVTHFVAVETDVTQRKEQEASYRRAKEHAEEANQAKGRFLAHVSHELRTPLNGILGTAELLNRRADAAQAPLTSALLGSARHLVQILNDLLDLSHIESGQFSLNQGLIEPQSLARDLVAMFEAQARAQGNLLRLRTRGLEGLRLRGDSKRLRQVLMNLVNNAVKFTRGGEVRLIMEAEREPADLCLVKVAVEDTGPGISREEAARIFEAFEQGRHGEGDLVKGTGLGLSISRQLLELMGAELGLDSEPGRGARFHFQLRLPVAAEDESPSLGRQPATELGPLSRAMVVDDNATNRQVMRSLLQDSGTAEVHLCASCAEALERIKHWQPQLVFLDIQMPDMDGISCAELLRAHWAGRATPLVAFSAHRGSDWRQEFIDQGFADFLTKPVALDDLRQLLRRLGFQPMDPAPEEGAAAAPPAPESIDSAALQRAFGGSEKLIRQFLTLFLRDYPLHLQRIRQALADQQPGAGANAAHTLKGQLGYFGTRGNLYQTARALEQCLKGGDSPGGGQHLEGLAEALVAAEPHLRQWLGAD